MMSQEEGYLKEANLSTNIIKIDERRKSQQLSFC